MTTGAWILILASTVPWVVWVLVYYLRNRKQVEAHSPQPSPPGEESQR